jgi:hypothetical protein
MFSACGGRFSSSDCTAGWITGTQVLVSGIAVIFALVYDPKAAVSSPELVSRETPAAG